MFDKLKPVKTISEASLSKGLKSTLFDGVFSQMMVVLTSGAFLAAFALKLGASNIIIGLLAAIGPLCQIIQLPSVFLINKIRYRKLIVSTCVFLSRFLWIVIAIVPWLFSADYSIFIFIILLIIINLLSSVAGCSWNSWIRDFVPENLYSKFFAKRFAIATGAGAALSVIAGIVIVKLNNYFTFPTTSYSLYFIIGGILGIGGLFFIVNIPEPQMESTEKENFLKQIMNPVKDVKFRNLLKFLATWNFAVNMASPFFIIYMINRLGLPLFYIIALTVLNQIINVLFFKIWGRISEKFSNKSCLSVACFIFLLSILIWPFTTLPDKYFLTIPLLILIHVLLGISTAGITLCSSTITLKFAPYGKATSYLALSGIINGLVAGLGSITAGCAGQFFELCGLKLTFSWIFKDSILNLSAMDLKGLDFVFIMAFIVGIYALHRLLVVRETGDVDEKIVYDELIAETMNEFRGISSSVGGKYSVLMPITASLNSLKNIVHYTKKTKKD